MLLPTILHGPPATPCAAGPRATLLFVSHSGSQAVYSWREQNPNSAFGATIVECGSSGMEHFGCNMEHFCIFLPGQRALLCMVNLDFRSSIYDFCGWTPHLRHLRLLFNQRMLVRIEKTDTWNHKKPCKARSLYPPFGFMALSEWYFEMLRDSARLVKLWSRLGGWDVRRVEWGQPRKERETCSSLSTLTLGTTWDTSSLGIMVNWNWFGIFKPLSSWLNWLDLVDFLSE